MHSWADNGDMSYRKSYRAGKLGVAGDEGRS